MSALYMAVTPDDLELPLAFSESLKEFAYFKHRKDDQMNDKNKAQLARLTGEPTNRTPIEIALGIDAEGRTTARKLYNFLELNQSNYSKWLKTNITENKFAEDGKDFYSYQSTNEGRGNFAQDFKLTASFAKKLCMTAKNQRGEEARNYFILVEDKLKEVAAKPLTPMQQIQLIAQGTMELEERVDRVVKDFQDFQHDLPLLGCDMDRITTAVKKMGVECLGGKDTQAYQDKSLRGKVYSDIYDQLKRQFGVSTYKSIKRSQCDTAVSIVHNYQLPIVLLDEITDANAQMSL